jgi:hypothetical protein
VAKTAEGQGAKKKLCFAHRILVFFLLIVLYDVTFNVTLRSKCEVFDSFECYNLIDPKE